MGGKHGAMMSIGSHGFGAASSKGAAQPTTQPVAPGGFTAAELQQHTAAMQARQGQEINGQWVERDSLARFLAEQPAATTCCSGSMLEPEPESKAAD